MVVEGWWLLEMKSLGMASGGIGLGENGEVRLTGWNYVFA